MHSSKTLGRTLHEEVKFDRSRVTSVDWATYPILSGLRKYRLSKSLCSTIPKFPPLARVKPLLRPWPRLWRMRFSTQRE